VKAEEESLVMHDKLLAVQNTTGNTKLIQKSPKQITHIIRAIHETKEEIREALQQF
jgi:hypothetical protein